MQLGIIIETKDPEKAWNAVRLGNKALDAGHTVELFLVNDGVEAPDITHDQFNARTVLKTFLKEGGTISACGVCLDKRDLEEGDLRPRGSMDKYLEIVEESDQVLTFG